MILPSLDYGDTIYDITQKTILENLQSAFNRGLKTTYNKEEFHEAPCLVKLKVNTLADRREIYHIGQGFQPL